MAKLDVFKILVKDEQNWEPGGDELYFTVNGTKGATSPSLGTGDSHIYPYQPVAFSGTASVSLFEDDPGWLTNNDDFIGTVTVDDTPGMKHFEFTGHGGIYEAWFIV